MSLVSLAHSGCCGTIGMQSKIMSGAATTLVLSHSAVGSGILRTFGCFFWKHLRNGNRRSTSAMADPCLFGRHQIWVPYQPTGKLSGAVGSESGSDTRELRTVGHSGAEDLCLGGACLKKPGVILLTIAS